MKRMPSIFGVPLDALLALLWVLALVFTIAVFAGWVNAGDEAQQKNLKVISFLAMLAVGIIFGYISEYGAGIEPFARFLSFEIKAADVALACGIAMLLIAALGAAAAWLKASGQAIEAAYAVPAMAIFPCFAAGIFYFWRNRCTVDSAVAVSILVSAPATVFAALVALPWLPGLAPLDGIFFLLGCFIGSLCGYFWARNNVHEKKDLPVFRA